MNKDLGKLNKLLETVSIVNVAPTIVPATKTSIAFYDDGSERRLYLYFNGAWRYVVLT
ncbi:MAG: hypothetical protein WCY38_06755 [Endomicrobiia bacterium]